MPFKLDTEIELVAPLTGRYIISSQHRKIGNPHKSIWTITRQEEFNCFVNSKRRAWYSENSYWGLRLIEGQIVEVGKNNAKKELKIAKFIGGEVTDIWHGYPADYLNRKQDIPAVNILITWVDNGYIGKSEFRKIRQGMPCNL